MKKSLKSLLALTLAIVLGLTMVACGSSEPAGTTTAAEGESQAASQAETKGEEPATQPSGEKHTSTKDTIVIATANETPSLTSVEHNAVAGSYMT